MSSAIDIRKIGMLKTIGVVVGSFQNGYPYGRDETLLPPKRWIAETELSTPGLSS